MAAQNLIVTDALRAQLLAAGAALHGLPTSDYTGLVAGQTYYAVDPATGDLDREVRRPDRHPGQHLPPPGGQPRYV